MITVKNTTNNLLTKNWRLFLLALVALTIYSPATLYAHQSPNSLIFLDVNPKSVAMEIQLPLPELELAFGNNISQNPESLIENFEPQLKEYLKAHIHAYSSKNNPWQVEIESLVIDKGKYIESGIAYWELIAHIQLKPQLNESTRKFTLDYDPILHQVINHVALVSVRSDWESGNIEATTAEATVIGWNTKDNVIYPLKINLDKGSWWLGFKSMVKLGMKHIQEGTDHLLFLFVLLLPSTLLVREKKWAEFGGIKYSILHLLKIVTAFTIGHSITLLIGALGWLHLPSQPVEVLIAFSILVSAIHAITPIFPGKEMYVASGFGLIHGLAFASILTNLNLDISLMAWSILGFNLGIELMQLFIITLIMPWIIILSQTTSAYKYFRLSFSIVAIVLAFSWIIEKISEEPNLVSTFILKASLYIPYGILILAIVSVFQYFISTKKPVKTESINNIN
ncbi:MAG: HupE/UreJ family protein [Bacteroidota bacterium]